MKLSTTLCRVVTSVALVAVFGLAFVGVWESASSTALAKKGGNGNGNGGGKGGGGGNGGGGADKDLQVCITMDPGGLTDDGQPYCGSAGGITAVVGRRRTITFALAANQPRRWTLTLGPRVTDVADDPEPNADGGGVSQSTPGDWSEHAIPSLPVGGITGELQVQGARFQHQGEAGELPNPFFRTARLRFKDARGQAWTLVWGPETFSGKQLTNPLAPAVRTTRQTDGSGNLISEWDVVTLGDMNAGRTGASTAFLWRDKSPHGPQDYWGAFDVSFSYSAAEEL